MILFKTPENYKGLVIWANLFDQSSQSELWHQPRTQNAER
jgi:hypothetical protein